MFEDLPKANIVEFKNSLVSFWYLVLWRHKAPYNLYEVKNGFLSSFNKMIHSSTMSILSLEAASSLSKKGVFETMEDFIFIRLYGFKGKPSLLPFFVSNRLFIVEVCKQYKYWVHFFNEKRKNKFIMLSWKVE